MVRSLLVSVAARWHRYADLIRRSRQNLTFLVATVVYHLRHPVVVAVAAGLALALYRRTGMESKQRYRPQ